MTSDTSSALSIDELGLATLRKNGQVSLGTGSVLRFSGYEMQSFQSAAKRVRDEISHRGNNFRGIDTYPSNVKNGAEDAEQAIATLKEAIADLEQIAERLKSDIGT